MLTQSVKSPQGFMLNNWEEKNDCLLIEVEVICSILYTCSNFMWLVLGKYLLLCNLFLTASVV
jgi:hypothetical protein